MSLNIGILSSAYKAAAPSSNLLLDDYPGAAAAYSFRKLRSAYNGPCCQILGGATPIDIGFVNNYIDLTALANAPSNSYISYWYDQSGNGNNVFLSNTGGGQIKISNVIQTINGKVTLLYNNPQSGNRNTSSINLKNGFSNFSVGRINSSTVTLYPLFSKGSGDISIIAEQNNNTWGLVREEVAWIARVFTKAPTTYTLFSSYYDGLNGGIRTNGTTQATGIYSNATTPNNPNLSIPYNTITGVQNYSNVSESVFYQSTQLANQSGIEANINSFYTIY